MVRGGNILSDYQNRETDFFSQNDVKKNQSPQAIQEKPDSADFDLSPG
jgi:hypothetical protein